MPTQMLTIEELQPPEGMDPVGVLRVLCERGDVVIVLEEDGESLAGFYQSNHGEHDRLLHVPPEFRWSEAAKLGAQRLRNRGDSHMRELNLDDVLPQHMRQAIPVPDLGDMLEHAEVSDAAE